MTDQEREALKFYAESANYLSGNGGYPSEVGKDLGQRARAALAAREDTERPIRLIRELRDIVPANWAPDQVTESKRQRLRDEAAAFLRDTEQEPER